MLLLKHTRTLTLALAGFMLALPVANALGEYPQVGGHVGFPVHGSRGDHPIVVPQIHQAVTGIGNRQCEHKACQCQLSKMLLFLLPLFLC